MKNKILLIMIISVSFLFADPPAEFAVNQSSEQCFYFVQVAELDEVSITENDWIGAFNGEICVGSSQWDGEYTTLAVMGNDGFSYSSGYCENGDIPVFKVWIAETGLIWEFTNNSSITGWSSNGTFIIENLGAYSSSPKIELSVAELNFGDTVVNEISTLSFYIRNVGEETLSGTLSTPDFFSIQTMRDPFNYEISAGDSLQVSANFSPIEEISYSDEFEFNSNSSINSQMFLDVLGIGIKAHISSNPELLEFENVWINHSVQKNLTISNDGSSVLNVTEIDCDEDSYSFSPENFSIETGEEQIVIVTFLPTSIQNYDTEITFISNIEDYSVNFTGDGYLLEANFTANPDSVEIGNSAQFLNNSSGDILSYAWNFGDGNSSQLENPNHEFTEIGDYQVSLTVSDQYFSDDFQMEFVVYGIPEISISPEELEFEDTYLGVTTDSQTVTIYSTRTAELIVTDISFQLESGAFNFDAPEFPFVIAPDNSVNITVNFTPNSAGNNVDLLLIHNNSNDSEVSCLLSGSGLVAPPNAVENLAIEIVGSNVQLSWNEVTETILGTPLTVQYYKIEASSSASGPFGWIGISGNTTFLHNGVAQYSSKYFYRVIVISAD